MVRRIFVISVAIVVTAVAAVCWLVFGQGAQVEKPVESTEHAVTSDTPKLTEATADRLESDLVSQDAETYRSAWVGDDLPSIAPAGATISIDVGTFQSQQDYGRVDATTMMPGKTPETWRLLLQFKDERWLVSTMEEVK